MDTKLVLVIEDDPQHRQMYGDLLWYNGFDVIFADSAETGYWFAVEAGPDLVVLDLRLPDMDGLELCRRLHAEPSTAAIPVVVLSGRPARDVATEALSAGCASYIEKPTPPLTVLHAVESLIGLAPGGAPRQELLDRPEDSAPLSAPEDPVPAASVPGDPVSAAAATGDAVSAASATGDSVQPASPAGDPVPAASAAGDPVPLSAAAADPAPQPLAPGDAMPSPAAPDGSMPTPLSA